MTKAVEIICGFHAVQEALRAGRRHFESVIIADTLDSARTRQIAEAAALRSIRLERIAPGQLRAIAHSDHPQGVAARVSVYPYVSLDTIIASSGQRPAFIVVLDSIVDTHNLGALIRSAHCAGAHGVVIAKDRAAGASPAVSNISAGAMEHMRIARVTNIAKSLQRLKNAGIWICGLMPAAQQSIYEAALTDPSALVIGGEQRGIRPLVQKTCDFSLAIPQRGRIDSLNASAAGAIAMFEVVRQRRATP
jgi:23S rRNA (guanosine2251-2'-O)-methyltransferase